MAIAAVAAALHFRLKPVSWKTFGLDSLVTAHGSGTIWNTSRSGTRFDPDATAGPWAPAKDVEAFLRDVADRPDANRGPREDAVFGLLFHQLGPQWHGVLEIKERYAPSTILQNPVVYQCMAVVAGVHGRSHAEGLRLRTLLAEAFSGLDEKACQTRAAAVIAPHLADAELVRRIDRHAGRHAFLTTALMGLVAWSRDESGALPPSEFLWLKGYSRSLWYALNGLGRGAVQVEAAGATAHYRAEKAAGVALTVPRVQSAVDLVMAFDAAPEKRS
jgi:intracellular multiplication protein IcmP